MNPIKIFYDAPYFERLVLTKPFEDYLIKEKQKIESTKIQGQVLDIGCGNGRSTRILAQQENSVVGIDFSKRLLKQAKENTNTTDIKYFFEDAESMHFDDSYFDIVGMFWNTFGNLLFLRDQVLREAKRVLKPNGRILMSVFSEEVLKPYLALIKKNYLKILQTMKIMFP